MRCEVYQTGCPHPSNLGDNNFRLYMHIVGRAQKCRRYWTQQQMCCQSMGVHLKNNMYAMVSTGWHLSGSPSRRLLSRPHIYIYDRSLRLLPLVAPVWLGPEVVGDWSARGRPTSSRHAHRSLYMKPRKWWFKGELAK